MLDVQFTKRFIVIHIVKGWILVYFQCTSGCSGGSFKAAHDTRFEFLEPRYSGGSHKILSTGVCRNDVWCIAALGDDAMDSTGWMHLLSVLHS